MFNVYNQLNNAASWKKWDPDLTSTGTAAEQQLENKKGFIILTPSASTKVEFFDAFTFRVTKGNERYDIVLIPQKYDKATNVIVSFKSNLLYNLLPGIPGKWQKKTPVSDLKNYMESPLSYYGVDFKKTTIKDMDMMVYSTVVNPANQFTEMAKWAKKIPGLVPAAELADSNKIYLQLTPVNNELTMLIGVHVKKQLSPTKELTYMRIPARKAFTVDYNGKYNERQKIYDGIEKYLHEHMMKNIMQPIEVYTKNALPLNDTALVNTQIIFSVF